MPADSSHQPTRQARSARLLGLRCAPLQDVVAVQSETKQVGWNETGLRRLETDDADDDAIDARDRPSLPAATSDQDGRSDRQHARDVIQPQQFITSRSFITSFAVFAYPVYIVETITTVRITPSCPQNRKGASFEAPGVEHLFDLVHGHCDGRCPGYGPVCRIHGDGASQ